MGETKPKPKSKPWPKLSGKMGFKAAEGKVFPVFVAPMELVRITSEKVVEIDCDKMEYVALNSLKRAVVDKDVVSSPAKGGK